MKQKLRYEELENLRKKKKTTKKQDFKTTVKDWRKDFEIESLKADEYQNLSAITKADE